MARLIVGYQFSEHHGKTVSGICRASVFCIQKTNGVKGSENQAGTIYQKKALFAHILSGKNFNPLYQSKQRRKGET